jgi:hypothetical protein
MRGPGNVKAEEHNLFSGGLPALDTVISALGTISQVGTPALERPEIAFCASLLPTMTFHTQTGRNAHRLS